MQHHLFVYGTLMRPAAAALMGGPERQRLWGESELIGAAKIRARLYDFGAYPGIVLASDSADAVVHGELLRLASPAATLPWLDAYEMIVPGDEATSEYTRVVAEATVAGEPATIPAWVYITRRDIRGLTPIAGGRWGGGGSFSSPRV